VEGRRRWKESFDLFQECQSLGIENFPKTFFLKKKNISDVSKAPIGKLRKISGLDESTRA